MVDHNAEGSDRGDSFDENREEAEQEVVEKPDGDSEDPTAREIADLPEVTRENVDERQGPHQQARNLNQSSVNSMEAGVDQDEGSVEELWQTAIEEGEKIFESQEDFNDRTNEEINHAEDLKTEIETTGTVETLENDDALDLRADSEYDREFVEGFITAGSGKDPVPLSDGLDAIETDAMRWGTFAGEFVHDKEIFDTYFQEEGQRNKSAAETSKTFSEARNDASGHFASHTSQLKQDVETLRDEVHLTSRDDGSGEISAVSNLARRVEEYRAMEDTASQNISEYEQAVSESNPSVPEKANSAVRNLLGVAEDEKDGVKAEFDPSEKEAVKTAWSMATVAAADSMDEIYQEVEQRKGVYEEVKQEAGQRRDEIVDLKEDVENLTAIEEVDDEVAEDLRELGKDTVLDLAGMSSGAELINGIDDSVYGKSNDENKPFVKGRADTYVEDAKDLVFGTEDEDGEYQEGLVDQYVEDVDAKVEGTVNSTGELDDRAIKAEQLEGMYRKSDELISLLTDVEERAQTEIDDYNQEISDLEDRYGVDDLGEYIESEVESSREMANGLLSEDDQIEV